MAVSAEFGLAKAAITAGNGSAMGQIPMTYAIVAEWLFGAILGIPRSERRN